MREMACEVKASALKVGGRIVLRQYESRARNMAGNVIVSRLEGKKIFAHIARRCRARGAGGNDTCRSPHDRGIPFP